jgi:hypothetical protein
VPTAHYEVNAAVRGIRGDAANSGLKARFACETRNLEILSEQGLL